VEVKGEWTIIVTSISTLLLLLLLLLLCGCSCSSRGLNKPLGAA
jgi:hypothetical protein